MLYFFQVFILHHGPCFEHHSTSIFLLMEMGKRHLSLGSLVVPLNTVGSGWEQLNRLWLLSLHGWARNLITSLFGPNQTPFLSFLLLSFETQVFVMDLDSNMKPNFPTFISLCLSLSSLCYEAETSLALFLKQNCTKNHPSWEARNTYTGKNWRKI